MAFAASKKNIVSLPGGGRKRRRFFPTSAGSTITPLSGGKTQNMAGLIDKTTPNPSSIEELGSGNMAQRDAQESLNRTIQQPLQRP